MYWSTLNSFSISIAYSLNLAFQLCFAMFTFHSMCPTLPSWITHDLCELKVLIKFMKRSRKPWNIVFINNYKRNKWIYIYWRCILEVMVGGGGGLMFVHWFNVSLYVCRSTQVFNGAVTRSSRKRSMYHLEGRLHTLFHILTILM